VLCCVLNSFVANYLIRLRVNTHVTVALVSRLPAPVVPTASPAFEELARHARTLAGGHGLAEHMPEYARVQALVAHLYGLGEQEFEHILETFPLLPADVKERALASFRDLS
jgi:hypothetical protein